VIHWRRTFLCIVSVVFMGTVFSSSALADSWQQPTQEELTMTSQPEVPGADAVYLYREESSDDRENASSSLDEEGTEKNFYTLYVRLKILTEAGKKYADVPVEYPGRYFSVADVQGRTIHSDGTVIPYTGKPFQKEIYKTNKFSEKETFFTMPDVQVGSILEYRYRLRYDARLLMAPEWFIQQDLFVRTAKYSFRAYGGESAITMKGGYITHLGDVAYTSSLPKGAEVKSSQLLKTFELVVHNVPPLPAEDFMLPANSMRYRVLFYYTADHTPEQYWADEGRDWSKEVNRFVASSKLKDVAAQMVAAGDSEQQKIRKIYDAVMQLENTSFTREISREEDKQAGIKTKTADDIWEQKRGNAREITLLFIALARAAGLKAYAAVATGRDENIFDKNFLDMHQLNDYLAIVEIDGKEQFFDPGQRYCEFGKLHWRDTSTDALRQTYDSTALIKTPGADYKEAQTVRIAQLQLGPDGGVHGTILIKMMGSPALEWRQRALRSDEAEMRKEFEREVQASLPAGVDATFNHFAGLADWRSVLVAQLDVSGSLATMAGRHIMLPSSFFETRSRPLFVGAKRETAVYLKYASAEQDNVTIALPKNFAVESLPQDVKLTSIGLYMANYGVKDNMYTLMRLMIVPNFLYLPDTYAGLEDFYQKLSAQDQQQAMLKVGPMVAGQ
jgi:Domain of Unknown Function with PDB structure (DUF3857)/Transglutaminase-like superfamily